MMNDYLGPLQGVNVIDFGHYYAGPMAAMLLADQGANVIRIVRPGEKELPESQYRLLNRNKKLLTLDLKTEEGRNQALLLIEKADVLIENFRPGVMKRLGLDYASVKNNNPGLVYLSLPGFASTDKARAPIQAWEGVLSAATGVYTETGLVRQKLGFPPLYSGLPVCSTQGAMQGAVAVMTGLLARKQQGGGTVIEVPLADAGLGMFSLYFGDYFRKGVDDPREELPQALRPFGYSPTDDQSTQIKKLRQGRSSIYESLSYFRDWTCGDGRKMYIWGLGDQALLIFLKQIGIYEQLLREGFVFVSSCDWVSELDNNVNDFVGLSAERKARLTQLISEALLTKTAEEWESILQLAGLAAGVARTREEWLALKPMLDSGVNTEVHDDDVTWTVPGRAVDMSGPEEQLIDGFQEAEGISFTQAGKLFADRNGEEYSVESIVQTKGGLLDGLKVLDLTNLLAGPTSTYVLAQYGADVIKADPSFGGWHGADVV